jgi:hypothetical protein
LPNLLKRVTATLKKHFKKSARVLIRVLEAKQKTCFRPYQGSKTNS